MTKPPRYKVAANVDHNELEDALNGIVDEGYEVECMMTAGNEDCPLVTVVGRRHEPLSNEDNLDQFRDFLGLDDG